MGSFLHELLQSPFQQTNLFLEVAQLHFLDRFSLDVGHLLPELLLYSGRLHNTSELWKHKLKDNGVFGTCEFLFCLEGTGSCCCVDGGVSFYCRCSGLMCLISDFGYCVPFCWMLEWRQKGREVPLSPILEGYLRFLRMSRPLIFEAEISRVMSQNRRIFNLFRS